MTLSYLSRMALRHQNERNEAGVMTRAKCRTRRDRRPCPDCISAGVAVPSGLTIDSGVAALASVAEADVLRDRIRLVVNDDTTGTNNRIARLERRRYRAQQGELRWK